MNWDGIIGFGVAGNMAGHLEQAGGTETLLRYRSRIERRPKECFPLSSSPNGRHQLHVMPLAIPSLKSNLMVRIIK